MSDIIAMLFWGTMVYGILSLFTTGNLHHVPYNEANYCRKYLPDSYCKTGGYLPR